MCFPVQYLFDELTYETPDGTSEFFYTLFKDEGKLKTDIEFIQKLFNERFTLFIYNNLLTGRALFENKILPNSEKENSYLKLEDVIILAINCKYNLTEKLDTTRKDHLQRLFSLSGIIESLDYIEKKDNCFFINKYAILKTLDTYFNCKIIMALSDSIYTNQDGSFFEWSLKRAETFLKVHPTIDCTYKMNTHIEEMSMKHSYYSNFINIYRLADNFFSAHKNGFGAELTMQAFYNFKQFKKSILSNIYNYIITEEEASGKKELFSHTWQKKLLLYNLLLNIDLEQKYPTDEKTFREFTIIKKNGKSESIGTKHFNDYKRNQVNSFFGN